MAWFTGFPMSAAKSTSLTWETGRSMHERIKDTTRPYPDRRRFWARPRDRPLSASGGAKVYWSRLSLWTTTTSFLTFSSGSMVFSRNTSVPLLWGLKFMNHSQPSFYSIWHVTIPCDRVICYREKVMTVRPQCGLTDCQFSIKWITNDACLFLVGGVLNKCLLCYY